MRVLLEPAGSGSPAAAALAAAGRATQAGQPTSLVSVHESAEGPLRTYDAAPPLPSVLSHAAAQSLGEGASPAMAWEEGGRRPRASFQFLARPPPALFFLSG